MNPRTVNPPPIPSPWRYRWREFRLRFLPAVVFGLSVFAAAALWEHGTAAGSASAPVDEAVYTAPADRDAVVSGAHKRGKAADDRHAGKDRPAES